MKILLSAIACNPNQGSEGGVGWKSAAALSQRHKVHVLTSTANRSEIEEALESGNYPNLSFTFFGTAAPYHENRLIARAQSWLRYVSWVKRSELEAEVLCAQHSFDLIHHVTYSSWRIPCPLWSLGIPLVWGPIGGVAEYPLRLIGKLSIAAAAFETVRNISNFTAMKSKELQTCLQEAAAVVCSNPETFDKLHRVRGKKDGMFILSPTFFTKRQIELFRFDARDKPLDYPLCCFAGGSMVGSKGLIFAIEAIKSANDKGIFCRLNIAGCGPEIPHLKKVVRRLGLETHVVFTDRLSGAEYIDALNKSHAFLLPSFRENAPGTILEAMLAGCVPVVVDASAQGDIVENEFGFKVPVNSANEITKGITEAIAQIARNPSLRISMGQKASDFVARTYREEAYVNGIQAIYEEVIGTT